MEWFRHFSDADTSLKLNNLIDKMGMKGYGQYWALFGLLNKKFDGINHENIKVHEHEILGKLRVRYVSPMREVLGSMEGLELFTFTRDERVYNFNCPMLLELMSKDSKYNRKKRLVCDQIAKPRFKNKDKEEDKDNTPTPFENSSPDFDPRKFLDAKKILPEVESEENLKTLYPRFTPDHFVDLWNEIFGERLKRISGIGSGKHLENFLKSLEFLPTENHWRDLFKLCMDTPKVMGQNDIGWTVTPTWIVDYDNAIKILNGDFDDAKHIKNILHQ